jgi:hypothetical protein
LSFHGRKKHFSQGPALLKAKENDIIKLMEERKTMMKISGSP